MDKNESRKAQDIKNPTFENKKVNDAKNTSNKKEKSLPWWVELLFVQIGLPDKWLIKVLKSKKKSSELLKNKKKIIFKYLFVLAGFIYFYPVVKYSIQKLDCQTAANKYIVDNKNTKKLNIKELKMISTNFCNGGNEIYEIENLND